MKRPHRRVDPAKTLEQLRNRVLGGSYICLDTLTDEELAALQELISSGEAEIVSSACRPHVIKKLDRIIVSH